MYFHDLIIIFYLDNQVIFDMDSAFNMLGLSQTTGYAVHALSCLSTKQTLFIQQVSDLTGIHKPYLAKIINQLTNKKLVKAKRGYRGGICLGRPPDAITLLDIVEAIEDQGWMSHCFLSLQACNSQHICPMHELWSEMKERIRSALQATTLADVIAIGDSQLEKRLEVRCRLPFGVSRHQHARGATAPGKHRKKNAK